MTMNTSTEELLIPHNTRNLERTGTRCSAYSTWHRTIPEISMVDIDSVETCKGCQDPLALIETARAGGFFTVNTKPHYVTRNLALKAGIPAFVLLYDVDDKQSQKPNITRVSVRQVAPTYGEAMTMTPQEWGEELVRLQVEHAKTCKRATRGGTVNERTGH